MINLNQQSVFIAEMPFGKTQNIECRLGRSLYMLDVDKNACTILDRKFFEHIHTISDAQSICNIYAEYLR